MRWADPSIPGRRSGNGLLVPESVDSGNGNRWYRESQLATARVVAVITALGWEGANVTGLAHGKATPAAGRAAGLIAGYWDEVEDRVATRTRTSRAAWRAIGDRRQKRRTDGQTDSDDASASLREIPRRCSG
jgi:hypothetical protein